MTTDRLNILHPHSKRPSKAVNFCRHKPFRAGAFFCFVRALLRFARRLFLLCAGAPSLRAEAFSALCGRSLSSRGGFFCFVRAFPLFARRLFLNFSLLCAAAHMRRRAQKTNSAARRKKTHLSPAKCEKPHLCPSNAKIRTFVCYMQKTARLSFKCGKAHLFPESGKPHSAPLLAVCVLFFLTRTQKKNTILSL